MKKKIVQEQQYESNIIKFDSIKVAKNGSFMVCIGKNILFLHPNLLSAVKNNANKKKVA